MNELIQKKLTKNDLKENIIKENIIKETDAQLPSSRREIEEDMLEQICLIANAGAEITVEELCSRMDMSRREVNFYLKQLKVHGYIIREKVTSTGHQKDGSGSGISLTEFGKITGEEFQYRHEILTQFLQWDPADSLQRNFVKGITKIEIRVGAGHRNFFQGEIFQ